ncbi:MAG: hypothetical protein KDE27_09995 [Planctomycetes bacterium]|nr:hypothetical protein [Planctomycetota bacterium]
MKKDPTAWLDTIDVAAPCTADWNAMQGDDRCRFCSQCSLHVFDLSALTRPEAEALVRSRLGGDDGSSRRLCVRFTRRADGTVLTRDCPVGLRQRLRRTASRLVAMCTAAFAFLGCRSEPREPAVGAAPATPVTPADPATMGQPVDQPQLQGEIAIMGDLVPPTPEEQAIQGRICVQPTVPPPDGQR